MQGIYMYTEREISEWVGDVLRFDNRFCCCRRLCFIRLPYALHDRRIPSHAFEVYNPLLESRQIPPSMPHVALVI